MEPVDDPRLDRGVQDLDREDERVAGQNSRGGLTVRVAVGRRHRDRDRIDFLSCDGLLKARHDAGERESSGAPRS